MYVYMHSSYSIAVYMQYSHRCMYIFTAVYIHIDVYIHSSYAQLVFNRRRSPEGPEALSWSCK